MHTLTIFKITTKNKSEFHFVDVREFSHRYQLGLHTCKHMESQGKEDLLFLYCLFLFFSLFGLYSFYTLRGTFWNTF